MYGDKIQYNKANEIRKKLLLFIDNELQLKNLIQINNKPNCRNALNIVLNNKITFEQIFSEKYVDHKIYGEIYSIKNKNLFLRYYSKFQKDSVNISPNKNCNIPKKKNKKPTKLISKLILHQKVLPIKILNFLINKKNTEKIKMGKELSTESYNSQKLISYPQKNKIRKDRKFLKNLCNSFKKNSKINNINSRRKSVDYDQLYSFNISSTGTNKKLMNSKRRKSLVSFQSNIEKSNFIN